MKVALGQQTKCSKIVEIPKGLAKFSWSCVSAIACGPTWISFCVVYKPRMGLLIYLFYSRTRKKNQDMLKTFEIPISWEHIHTVYWPIVCGTLLHYGRRLVRTDTNFPTDPSNLLPGLSQNLGHSLCFLWNCRLWTRNSWTPIMSQTWTKMQVTRRWVLCGWAPRALAHTLISLVTQGGETLLQRFWRDFWFLFCSSV